MKVTPSISCVLSLALVWLVPSLPLAAETRAFTDTSGRTIRGEFVGATGDLVTIKREDGQNFTVKANSFCDADITYFKAHGLKNTPEPAAGTASTPASTAPMRLEVKVTPKRKDRNAQNNNYETSQQITYKVDVRNAERTRGLDKMHGTLISIAKVLSSPDESQVIGIESFDGSVKPLATFNYESEQPSRARYYGYDQKFGIRYVGFLLVLKDGADKIVNVSASSETTAKHAEEMLKLKLWDQFDKNFKKTKNVPMPTE